jgi:ABC-type glycerol-3-phosphate transport system substrate-binding protein
MAAGWRSVTLSVSLGLAACGDGSAGDVSLATWWARRGEFTRPFETLKQGLREESGLEVQLAHKLQSKYYHMLWIDEQLNPATASPERLDVFAANNGSDVLRWTPCARSPNAPSTSRLRALNDPALGPLSLDWQWMQDNFDHDVLDTLGCDNQVYALPVGIHRINTLFYNKRLLMEVGYDVDGSGGTPLPTSFEELVRTATDLQRRLDTRPPSNPESSVFVLPQGEPWTLSLFFMENVMLAQAQGTQQYTDYWSGTDCDPTLFAAALRSVRRLEPFFGTRSSGEEAAIQEVNTGHAALLVTGDWAIAEVDEAVGHIPFPGTGDTFVFTADVFALPDISSSNADNGLHWLRAVTEARVQREYAAQKDALTGRVDGPSRRPENGPAWLRSLPALLPGKEINAPADAVQPFESLPDRLSEWLDAKDAAQADKAMAQYAADECAQLSRTTSTVPFFPR